MLIFYFAEEPGRMDRSLIYSYMSEWELYRVGTVWISGGILIQKADTAATDAS